MTVEEFLAELAVIGITKDDYHRTPMKIDGQGGIEVRRAGERTGVELTSEHLEDLVNSQPW